MLWPSAYLTASGWARTSGPARTSWPPTPACTMSGESCASPRVSGGVERRSTLSKVVHKSRCQAVGARFPASCVQNFKAENEQVLLQLPSRTSPRKSASCPCSSGRPTSESTEELQAVEDAQMLSENSCGDDLTPPSAGCGWRSCSPTPRRAAGESTPQKPGWWKPRTADPTPYSPRPRRRSARSRRSLPRRRRHRSQVDHQALQDRRHRLSLRHHRAREGQRSTSETSTLQQVPTPILPWPSATSAGSDRQTPPWQTSIPALVMARMFPWWTPPRSAAARPAGYSATMRRIARLPPWGVATRLRGSPW